MCVCHIRPNKTFYLFVYLLTTFQILVRDATVAKSIQKFPRESAGFFSPTPWKFHPTVINGKTMGIHGVGFHGFQWRLATLFSAWNRIGTQWVPMSGLQHIQWDPMDPMDHGSPWEQPVRTKSRQNEKRFGIIRQSSFVLTGLGWG